MSISWRSATTVGVDALSANPLRTLLSTLGIVMGVGAMVSVLAMGDGVAKFAQQQIAETTDLLGIAVAPVATTSLDGISVRRADVVRFTLQDVSDLAAAVPGIDKTALIAAGNAMATVNDTSAQARGFAVMGTLSTHFRDAGIQLTAGRAYTDTDTAVVVLNERAAGVVAGDSTRPALAVGRFVSMNGARHEVIGVVAGGRQGAAPLVAFVPVADAARSLPPTTLPNITLVAPRIQDVDSIRAGTERWAASRFGANWKERITVRTNESRVAQAVSAMAIFKLLMGAITGVSLLVGGVGIMNVLLAAVAERTREIGVRKATGARHRDILLQFLAESVAITSAGGFLGVLLGLSIAFIVAAVMRAQTKAQVFAAVEPVTIVIAAGLSVLIGVLFGLYPAVRAARLSPIDAIRHE